MTVNIQGVIRLTPSIRKKATTNIWQRKEEAFDMNRLHVLIQETLTAKSLENQGNLFEQLRQVDLTQFVSDAPGLDEFFTCSFFVKRFAWISRNEKGEYRYFSKIKDGYGYYAFDLIDLLTILLNKTAKKTIEHLQESFSIQSISHWDEEQKDKYMNNTSVVQSLCTEKTPSLKKILKNGTDILTAFLAFGQEKVNGRHLSDGENAIFFISNHYFKERYFPKKSVSTLNQWINLFAVLGLIEKTTNVPNELQVEAEKRQALAKKNNHVSFYCVPQIDSVLENAENRASLLVQHRISYHQITKAVVLSIFGQTVHDHVYVQKTHGRKKQVVKKNKECETERNIEHTYTFFKVSLAEKGMVVKSELNEMTKLPTSVFNSFWKELVSSSNCELTKPTKEECEKYGLTRRQTVAKVQKEVEMGHIWRDPHKLPWDEGAPVRLNSAIPA